MKVWHSADVICTYSLSHTHPYVNEMKFHFMSHWIFTNDLALYGINLIRRMKIVFTKSLPLRMRNYVICGSVYHVRAVASENVLHDMK